MNEEKNKNIRLYLVSESLGWPIPLCDEHAQEITPSPRLVNSEPRVGDFCVQCMSERIYRFYQGEVFNPKRLYIPPLDQYFVPEPGPKPDLPSFGHDVFAPGFPILKAPWTRKPTYRYFEDLSEEEQRRFREHYLGRPASEDEPTPDLDK